MNNKGLNDLLMTCQSILNNGVNSVSEHDLQDVVEAAQCVLGYLNDFVEDHRMAMNDYSMEVAVKFAGDDAAETLANICEDLSYYIMEQN